MKMKQQTVQQTNQYQPGYQFSSLDQNQHQLPGARQQTLPQQYSTKNQVNDQGRWVATTVTQPQPQGLGSLNYTEREFTVDQKAEEMKRKLKKRGILEADWQYYLKSPHSWDFINMSSSGLCKGVEIVLLSPVTCTPNWIDKE